jgi:hypothetical protein
MKRAADARGFTQMIFHRPIRVYLRPLLKMSSEQKAKKPAFTGFTDIHRLLPPQAAGDSP